MNRALFLAATVFSIVLLLSACSSAPNKKSPGPALSLGAPENGVSISAYPATMKLRRHQAPAYPGESYLGFDAARGEEESAQIVIRNMGKRAMSIEAVSYDLVGPAGAMLRAELGVVGYIPVTKPTLVGYGRRGLYPDPILPISVFTVEPGVNQAVWVSVRVPRNAEPGIYEGSITLDAGADGSASIPVSVRVYAVTLPVASSLKTSINFRQESVRDPRYYGDYWSDELEAGLPNLGLRFRFSHRVDLPLMQTLEALERGEPSERAWASFDDEVRRWLAEGISAFELKLPISWEASPDRIRKEWGTRLRAINDHVVSRSWRDIMYFYFYDEPSAREMKAMRARLEAIREFAPDIHNVLTMGTTRAGERALRGLVGIWVPNLHQFDERFARDRVAAGEQVWAYACVGNNIWRYPDNFRIDWHGTAHRALGWWLYARGIQGYLYWAVDLWRQNPWEDAATFPWTNGDGMMFYPAPDGRSQMYPSVRVHMMRDGFEDYDLLAMLAAVYPERLGRPREVSELLAASKIADRGSYFNKDDGAYIDAHRRLLELLEASGSQ
jgi:hypothetical protein